MTLARLFGVFVWCPLWACQDAAWEMSFQPGGDTTTPMPTEDGCVVEWQQIVLSLGASSLISGGGETAGRAAPWAGEIWSSGGISGPGGIVAPGRYEAVVLTPAAPSESLDGMVAADILEQLRLENAALWVDAAMTCSGAEPPLRIVWALPGPAPQRCVKHLMEVGGSSTMPLQWALEPSVLFDAFDDGGEGHYLGLPIAMADLDGDGEVTLAEMAARDASTSGYLPGRAGQVVSLAELVAQRSRHVLSFLGGRCDEYR
jgi:hypothetical protein